MFTLAKAISGADFQSAPEFFAMLYPELKTGYRSYPEVSSCDGFDNTFREKKFYLPSSPSLIPHPSSLIPRPSSLVPHPSSPIPHPSSPIPHPSSLIPHPSSLIPHPSPLTPHPSPLIPHPSSPIPHPSSLIPHPSSPIPHPSSLIPHPSSLVCCALDLKPMIIGNFRSTKRWPQTAKQFIPKQLLKYAEI
ncbi:MAG: hypothetical protein KatS3mg030_114 [Saprospiraceae bacterium]|nr:MAG: hypothetical protein KatS3mg030_114 [Saprospiraceae bacterium]